MGAFEKWSKENDGVEDGKWEYAEKAFRAGMRLAAEIAHGQAMTIAGHMKPYEPITTVNAALLLEDCADACVDIYTAILAEAEK